MKRIQTEMAILERKVVRNHEAFLSQQGKTDVATEKLKPCGSLLRRVPRTRRAHLGNRTSMSKRRKRWPRRRSKPPTTLRWVGSESLTDESQAMRMPLRARRWGADQSLRMLDLQAQETASDTDDVAQEDQAADETPATDEAADEQQAAGPG